MTRLLRLLFLFFLLPLMGISQGKVFYKEITFTNNLTQINSMCNTSDGYVLMGGTTRGNLVLMKLKLNGDTLWTRFHDNQSPSLLCYGTAEHYNNSYITAGTKSTSGERYLSGFLTRHDSLGRIIWSVKSSDGQGNMRWWDAAVGPDSSIATAGYRDYGTDKGLVSKFDASGKLLWTQEGSASKNMEYQEVAFDKSGNVIACGHISSVGNVVTKFDPNGKILWNKSSTGGDSKGLVVLPSGNILVSGQVAASNSVNIYLHKFGASGKLLFAKEYWTNAYCEALEMELSYDDKLTLYGEAIMTPGSGSNYQQMIMVADTNGKLDWSYGYGDSLVQEQGRCGIFASDSAHWVVGFVNNAKNIIFKTDQLGNSSCLRSSLNFTDSVHKITYTSGPTINSYSLQNKSFTWGKGVNTFKDTTVCSKNLCKLKANAKVLSDFNGWGVSCHREKNGVAMVKAQNGTMPLKYEWSANAQSQTSDTAKGLSAGKYYVTVTDANTCSVVDSVVITQPDSLSDSLRILSDFSGWNISCNSAGDARVVLTISGGVAPKQYFWNGDTLPTNSDTVSNLSGGWNDVVIRDANNCEIIDSILLSEPTPLKVSIVSSTKSGCDRNDAMAIANASEGAGGYSYLWDASAGLQTTDTAKALAAGKYWVVAKDVNGCLDSTSVDILDHDQPKVQMGPIKNPTCFGDCNGEATVLTLSGKSPFRYQWGASAQNQTTPKASSLCDGEYWVVVTDSHNCKDSAQATLVEPVTLDTTVLQGANGLTSNALAVDYQWLDCDNANAPISGAISQTFMPVTSGSYSVVVSNDSCSDTSRCYYVISVGNTFKNSSVSMVEVWPNPAFDRLNLKIKGTENTWHLKVVDAFGKEHMETTLHSNEESQLSIDHLSPGFYQILLKGNRDFVTATFLIE